MGELDQLAQLQRAHHRRLLGLRAATASLVAEAWDRYGGLDDQALAAFSASASVVVDVAKANVATIATGFMNANDRVAGFPGLLVPELPVIRNGVPTDEVYGRSVITARRQIAKGLGFVEAMAAGRARAVSTARTDVVLTNRAAMAGGKASRPWVVGYRRVLVGGSCGFCATASTQRYTRGDLLPLHPACVVGSTIVGGDDLRQVSRRWYSGEMITIRTAAGHELTITPNHPVLTNRGWIPAGELYEGQELVSRSDGHRVRGGVPYEHDVPAGIEDRFRAGLVAPLVSVPFATEDFHGDWGDGEVDVVLAYRHLGYGLFAKVAQPVPEELFATAWASGIDLADLCSTHQDLLGAHDSPVRRVGGRRLSRPLLRGHFLGSFEASSGVSSWGYPGGDQMLADRRARDTEPSLQTPLGLAGDVSLDRITELRRVNSGSHVFNLHTGVGWYYANGIVVHNCDCGIAEILGNKDPGHVINRDLLNKLKAEGVVQDITRARQRAHRSAYTVDAKGAIRKVGTVDGEQVLGEKVRIKVTNHPEMGATLGGAKPPPPSKKPAPPA